MVWCHRPEFSSTKEQHDKLLCCKINLSLVLGYVTTLVTWSVLRSITYESVCQYLLLLTSQLSKRRFSLWINYLVYVVFVSVIFAFQFLLVHFSSVFRSFTAGYGNTSSSGDSELLELRRKKLQLECSKLELEIERIPLECAKLELQIQLLQRDILSGHNNI